MENLNIQFATKNYLSLLFRNTTIVIEFIANIALLLRCFLEFRTNSLNRVTLIFQVVSDRQKFLFDLLNANSFSETPTYISLMDSILFFFDNLFEPGSQLGVLASNFHKTLSQFRVFPAQLLNFGQVLVAGLKIAYTGRDTVVILWSVGSILKVRLINGLFDDLLDALLGL